MDITKVLLVLLGGALGSGCRYWISELVHALIEKPTLPYATFIVNISGSFIIGVLAELFDARVSVSPTVRAVLMIGVLGGYTTFSSFSLEVLHLIRDGETLRAIGYALGSLILGLLAVWMGVRLVRLF